MRKRTEGKTSKPRDLFEIKVKKILPQGDGLAYVGPIPVSVPQGIPGDVIRMRILRKGKIQSTGKIVEVLEPSPMRIAPPCPLFPKCGGCRWQMISYEGQLELKRELIRQGFRKIAGIHELPLEPIVGMEEPWHFLNKVQYALKRVRDGRVLLGYHQRETKRIIDLDSCPIQIKGFDTLTRAFKDLIGKEPVTVYDEKSRRGKMRYLILRGSEKLGEILVVLIMRLPGVSRALASKIVALNPTSIVGVVENINPTGSVVSYGERSKAIDGRDYYVEEVMRLRFRISAASPFPENLSQTEQLMKKLLTLVEGKEFIVDGYSGVGLFSITLSKWSRKVVGIENSPSSYYDSLENRELNGTGNVEFILGRMEDFLSSIGKPDLLLLNAPREGLADGAKKAILEARPLEIAYLSSDPTTLARDTKDLLKMGYELSSVVPFDFRPHSPQVVTLAYFLLR